jgi:hypothetical protein
MAETLGSLIDKLTIKGLREYHLNEMMGLKDKKLRLTEIKEKIKLVKSQKKNLLKEIEQFVSLAAQGKILLKEEKIKLYNPKEQVGRIPVLNKVARAIACLAQKNSELWHLEDEARRTDVPLSYIGRIKRKIDFANQQRNDLIDKIDELFEKKIRKSR